jgi:hypothetical protein
VRRRRRSARDGRRAKAIVLLTRFKHKMYRRIGRVSAWGQGTSPPQPHAHAAALRGLSSHGRETKGAGHASQEGEPECTDRRGAPKLKCAATKIMQALGQRRRGRADEKQPPVRLGAGGGRMKPDLGEAFGHVAGGGPQWGRGQAEDPRLAKRG